MFRFPVGVDPIPSIPLEDVLALWTNSWGLSLVLAVVHRLLLFHCFNGVQHQLDQAVIGLSSHCVLTTHSDFVPRTVMVRSVETSAAHCLVDHRLVQSAPLRGTVIAIVR